MLDIFYKLLSINPALAQDIYGTNDLVNANLGTRDLVDTVTGIINIALGFLGILGVILILYGGFVWMTSRGNSERIQRAKTIIIGAIIGLLIVLASYAIARFVINQFSDATGANNTNNANNNNNNPNLPTCPEPNDLLQVEICDINPDSGPVGSYVNVIGWHFGTDPGTVNFSGTNAEVVTCSSEPIWDPTRVRVRVPDGLAVGDYVVNLTTSAGNSSNESASNFHVNDLPVGVEIACLNPDSGPTGQAVAIEGIGFTDTQDTVRMLGWVGNDSQDIIITPANWTETQIDITIPNNALASNIEVEVAGDTDSEFFIVTCDDNGQCASGCCHNGDWCRPLNYCEAGPPAGPHISEIDPPDGAAGNLVTIYGSGFGAANGTVTFYDNNGHSDLGVLPNTLNNACDNYWTDTAIVVGVPAGVDNDNLQVYVTTNGGEESNPYNFNKNNTVRPGICELEPNTGAFWTSVTAQGIGIAGGNRLLFGQIPGYNIVVNGQDSITAQVPNLLPGIVRTQVEYSGGLSNSLPFTILPTSGGDPIIAEISPGSGPVGQYLTVMGANFGNAQGQITFDGVNGDFNFPDQCADNFWQNDRIIVKVPAGVLSGNADVIVTRNGDGAVSNTYDDFVVTAGNPGPGLCLLDPDNGPRGLSINLFGEGFGAQMGNVVFYNNQNSTPDGPWNNNQILNTEVPVGAITGPVHMVRNSDGAVSNNINFNVGACPNDAYCTNNGLGEVCCPDPAGAYCTTAALCSTAVNQCIYTWSITTESDLFITDNGPTCDDACGNALVYVEFNTEIQGSDLVAGNFAIYACTDPNNCDTSNNLTTGVTQAQNGSEYWRVTMAHGNFNVDGYYQVVIDPDIENIYGDPLADDPRATWIFRVGNANCQLDHISISPLEGYVEVAGTTGFISQAHSEDGICGGAPIICQAPDCTWNGWTSDNASIATVLANNGQPDTIATGVALGDTLVSTQATQNGNDFDAAAQIHVVEDLGNNDFRITNHFPDCEGICTDSAVYFQANRDLAPNQDWEALFSVRSASQEYFDHYQRMGQFHILWTDPLPFGPNTDLTVTISGDLLSSSGEPLGVDYVWDFSTGGESCQVDYVTVIPETYNSTVINESITYFALPIADDNICGDGIVLCQNCSYAWSSSDPTIATVNNINDMVTEAQVVLAEGMGTTEIETTVNEPGNPNDLTDSGTLNVSLGYHPQIIESLVEPIWPPDLMCLNTAIVVPFDQLMNTGSIPANLKVYRVGADTGNGCIPYGPNFLCPLAASYTYTQENIDLTDPELETKVIVNTNDYFEADATYAILVNEAILGQNGLPLDPTQINFPLNGINYYRHVFLIDSAAQVCRINFMEIQPSDDIFTCAANNCPDDADPAAGNQHLYTALAYDIRGTLLNTTGVNHTWQSNDETLLAIDESDTDGQIAGTAQHQNGQTVLSVSVDDLVLGSGMATAGIEIFLCENPWPSQPIDWFTPWSETDYNFSTYYCMESGIQGDPILPNIGNPTINTHVSDPNILREYIFLVDYSVALRSGQPDVFGTLAVKEDNNKFDDFISWLKPPKAAGQGSPTDQPDTDVIGLRVMQNNEHLTVYDWYKKYAPNPNENGSRFEVDGYQALQVGNTIYMAATNLSGGDLYTNIYILAGNIGARPETMEIVSQMLDNWVYNINVDQQDNVCTADPTIACSSDFDCPGVDTCQSRGLKLRRDLVRLGDLFNIRNLVEAYGQNHKACSNNNLITCTDEDQCPAGGECVPYYPLLNAGSYVGGLSTSQWPSWQQTLSPALASVLPEDMIGQFNGCPDGADPDTCWNEDDLVFTCPVNSLIYLYNSLSSGTNYHLGSNFEYDLNPDNGITFAGNLTPGLPGHILTNLYPDYCDANPINGSVPGDALCGNGIVNAGEECDGGFRDNMCELELGDHGWWNEQSAGCYPPGTIVDGNLVECHWYNFNPPLTPAQCGGYCRDNIFDTIYESCEVVNGTAHYDGNYSCSGGVALTCGNSCQPMCGSSPAAQCGDGIWTAGAEECDASADPDGLDGIACSQNGHASCNPVSCRIECDQGTAYAGACGDGDVDYACSIAGNYSQADCLSAGGIWDTIEDCDYASWETPPPGESGPYNPYLCRQDCTFGTNYCGDGDWQNSYGERCDPGTTDADGNYIINPEPTPPITTAEASSDTNQYQCRADCLPLEGGYCGDDTRQDYGGGNPEQCDDGNEINGDVCSNSCDWTCYANASGLPSGNVITYSPVTFGASNLASISLQSDQNTTLNLPHCRVSGNVLVDLNIPPYQPETTGVVFVTDLTGSMQRCISDNTSIPFDMADGNPPDTQTEWGQVNQAIIQSGQTCEDFTGVPGDLSKIEAVIQALNGNYTDSNGNGFWDTGEVFDNTGALDVILANNPNADVALVSFGPAAGLNVNFSRDLNTLKAAVASYRYTANRWGTDHRDALCAAYYGNHAEGTGPEGDGGDLDCEPVANNLNWSTYNNKVAVFMTDGLVEHSGNQAGDQAANFLKNTQNFELFTVLLGSDGILGSYMNFLSSSNCIRAGGDAPNGTCGDGIVECRNTANPNQFEECDGVNCDASCQWINTDSNRSYQARSVNDIVVMYEAIAGSIPIVNNRLILNGTEFPIYGEGAITDFVIDTRQLNISSCEEGDGENRVPMSIHFSAAPGATATISNGDYRYCPWED